MNSVQFIWFLSLWTFSFNRSIAFIMIQFDMWIFQSVRISYLGLVESYVVLSDSRGYLTTSFTHEFRWTVRPNLTALLRLWKLVDLHVWCIIRESESLLGGGPSQIFCIQCHRLVFRGCAKHDPTCFCQNFIKFPPNLIIFGTQIAKTI